MARFWRVAIGDVVIKFVEDLRISCEGEKDGCCVLLTEIIVNLTFRSWWSFSLTCLQLSLIIILAKYDTMLDHVMTRTLIWTACTVVDLWICIHWVPVGTPDIPNVFHLSPTFANKFRLSATDRPKGSNWNFFPIAHCQPTDRSSVVGDHSRKIRTEREQSERKKERKKKCVI